MVDFWRLWAKKQQVNIKFIPLTWSETLQQVKQGSIDIHGGLSITKDRQKSFAYSESLFFLNNYIYIHQNLESIDKLSQLIPYAVGAVKNSSHISSLNKLAPQLFIKSYHSRIAKYQAALNGDILAFADIGKLSKQFGDSNRLSLLFPKSKRFLFSKQPYAVAVAKDNKSLLNFINQGIAKISLEEKSIIERKWLGIDKQSDTLLLAFSPKIPPYMTLSPNGTPEGLFVDLWRLWSKYSGQKIDFVAEDLATSTELVKQHSADVMIAFPESKQNNVDLRKAWHIYNGKSKVFVASKYPNIKSLADLSGYNLGLFVTAPYKHKIAQQYPDIHLHFFSELQSMLNAAENGEIDAMISSTDIMNLKLIQSSLQSAFYLLESPVFSTDLYSVVAKDNQRLVDIIKEGIASIPQDELFAIEKKWLPNRAFYKEQSKKITFTEKEQNWLKQELQVDIGITKNWQPMEFVNEQGKIRGINIDVLKLIAKRTQLNINFVVFDNWKSLYQALVNKKVALAAGISPSKERLNKLLFSNPYWELPWVVLHPQTLGKNLSLKDFYGKKVAVVKGYRLIDYIKEKYPQITLVTVDTTQQAINAIEQNLVAGALEPLVIASELLKKDHLTVLSISVLDDFSWENTHIAIRKDWPLLKTIINKGIATISEDEKQHIYEKWINIKIHTGFDKNVVIKIALQVGILILVVLIVIVVWNRRLSSEIQQRKKLEEKMKHMATHDELTGLGNRALLKDRLTTLIALHQRQDLQLAVLFIDLDGFKTINDNYGHDVGDELLKQLAARLQQNIRTSDTLIRFGGDEFVLLLTGLHNHEEAAFIADKILKLLKTPFKLSAVTTCVGCSIGIALYPDDGTDGTELLKVADTLMYKVKAQGKNNYLFNQELH